MKHDCIAILAQTFHSSISERGLPQFLCIQRVVVRVLFGLEASVHFGMGNCRRSIVLEAVVERRWNYLNLRTGLDVPDSC